MAFLPFPVSPHLFFKGFKGVFMHYYQFNIADYRKDTRHLTVIEHYIYRELLDEYYLSELPLPSNIPILSRRLRLTSEQIDSLNIILDEFFILKDDGYHNDKADLVLGKIYKKSEKARESVNKRWEKYERNTNVSESYSERNTNVILPNTYNPKPSNPKPTKTCLFKIPDWVNQKAFKEFTQHRKEMNKPFTDLSKTKVCNKLKGYTDEEQQTAIDTSIESRWAGVFPKKLNGKNNETTKINNARPESNLARLSRKLQADIASEDPFGWECNIARIFSDDD